jgi:hypothetical protein
VLGLLWDKSRTARLFWKSGDGSREAVQLTTDDAPRQLAPDFFSPDGSLLTFFSRSPETGFDIGLLRLDGIDPYAGKLPKPEVLVQTRSGEAFEISNRSASSLVTVGNQLSIIALS